MSTGVELELSAANCTRNYRRSESGLPVVFEITEIVDIPCVGNLYRITTHSSENGEELGVRYEIP